MRPILVARPTVEDVFTRRDKSATLVSRLRRFARPQRTMMRCGLCDLVGGPFPAEEAAALLAVHEQLQHGRFVSRGPALPPVAAD